jgi:hypothetical protein
LSSFRASSNCFWYIFLSWLVEGEKLYRLPVGYQVRGYRAEPFRSAFLPGVALASDPVYQPDETAGYVLRVVLVQLVHFFSLVV